MGLAERLEDGADDQGRGVVAEAVEALRDMEALRMDAERYRWLRANMMGVIHLIGRPGIRLSGVTGDGLDALVDEVRDALFAHCKVVAEAQTDAAATSRLRAEAASFHMAYRLKCDEETKAQAVEIERLRAALRATVNTAVAAERERWRTLRDQLQADHDRPEGRWGMRGHKAVDDDYFLALGHVLDRMGQLLGPN